MNIAQNVGPNEISITYGIEESHSEAAEPIISLENLYKVVILLNRVLQKEKKNTHTSTPQHKMRRRNEEQEQQEGKEEENKMRRRQEEEEQDGNDEEEQQQQEEEEEVEEKHNPQEEFPQTPKCKYKTSGFLKERRKIMKSKRKAKRNKTQFFFCLKKKLFTNFLSLSLSLSHTHTHTHIPV